MPPHRSLARRFSSHTSTLTFDPATSAASAVIASANVGGRRSPGGVLTQSRACATASVTVWASSTARPAADWRANELSTTCSAGPLVSSDVEDEVW